MDFHALTSDPHSVLEAVADELRSRGIAALDVRAAVASVQPSLHRERFNESEDADLLSPAQVALWKSVSDDRVWATLPRISPAAESVLEEFESDEAARRKARTSIKTLTAKVATLQTLEDESKAVAGQRTAEAKEAARQITELTREAERLKSQLEIQGEAAESLRVQLEHVRTTLSARTHREQADQIEIGVLRERLSAGAQRLEELNRDLSARESQILQGQTALNQVQGRYAEQGTRLDAEMRRVDDLRGTLSARESRIAQLQAALEVADHDQARLGAEVRPGSRRSRNSKRRSRAQGRAGKSGL